MIKWFVILFFIFFILFWKWSNLRSKFSNIFNSSFLKRENFNRVNKNSKNHVFIWSNLGSNKVKLFYLKKNWFSKC